MRNQDFYVLSTTYPREQRINNVSDFNVGFQTTTAVRSSNKSY